MTEGTSSKDGDSAGAPPSYSTASPLSLSLISSPDAQSLLISLIPPKEPVKLNVDTKDVDSNDIKKNRPPMDFVLTIDVSASMDKEAPAPGESEPTGLTVLDVVKHAAKTIITTMKDQDRVAVVTFSRDSKVVVPLTQTNSQGKQTALEIVARLKSESNTNLWDGLKASMNVLAQAEPVMTDDSQNTTRLSSVFLLTDGVPNVTPPRGHVPMLKLYLEQHPPDKTHFTINTFGFGYDLDSQLLVQLAEVGGGSYSFIPDSGMVGTVFVHAIANTYATFAEGCYVDIEIDEEDVVEKLKVLGNMKWTKTSWGLKIPLGSIQYGQTRDLVISFDPEKKCTSPITVNARYIPGGSAEEMRTSNNITPVEDINAPRNRKLIYHRSRLLFISAVQELFSGVDALERTSSYGMQARSQAFPANAHKSLSLLASGIRRDFPEPSGSLSAIEETDALALAEDIEGQVLMAVKENSSWTKWGRHYLPSLSGSHLRQQCSNFKDAGLQAYGRGSPLFIACRDEIDTVFDNLPPPTPTFVPDPIDTSPPSYAPAGQAVGGGLLHGAPRALRNMLGDRRAGPSSPGIGGGGPTPPPAPSGSSSRGRAKFKMSSYNMSSAPCFSGESLINVVGTSETVKVQDVRKGTVVSTPIGPRKVLNIVRTEIIGAKAELCQIEGLLITPWHPIKLQGSNKWVFPADVVQQKVFTCNAVYSILLEPDRQSDAHAVFIGGVLCVTLGHGIVASVEDVRSHVFLGSYTDVIRDLRRYPDAGSVDGVLNAIGVVRDQVSGLVNGFEWKAIEKGEVKLATGRAIPHTQVDHFYESHVASVV